MKAIQIRAQLLVREVKLLKYKRKIIFFCQVRRKIIFMLLLENHEINCFPLHD